MRKLCGKHVLVGKPVHMHFFISNFHFPDPCTVRSGTKAVNCDDAVTDGLVRV